MNDLSTYLQKLDEMPFASSVANLNQVRTALDKLNYPDSFDIDTIEKEIVGLSPELYTFIFRQARLGESKEPIADRLTAAITKLGFDRVKKLIFFHVAFSNDIKNSSNLLEREFAAQLWSLNYRVASTAAHWAIRVLPGSSEELFYLGMLQNIGISALALLEPSKHRSLRESKRQVPLAEKEKEHLGVNHYEIGIAMVQRWGLPTIHASAMKFEQTHGQSAAGFADGSLEDLFTLLYFAKYRAENRKYRTNALTDATMGIDPKFNYNRLLLQIAADMIREAA